MNAVSISEAKDEVLRHVMEAAERAAICAREIAARTGTAVIYERDGKLVREYPTMDEFRNGGEPLTESARR